jgi:WD40 repeat protein
MKARAFLSIALLILGSKPSFGDETNPITIKPLHILGSVQLKHDGAIYALTCSPKGDYLASYGEDGIIRLWDTTTFEQVWEVNGHRLVYSRGFTFSPDGKYLAVANDVGPWLLIEVASAELIPFFDDLVSREVSAITFSPNGKRVAFYERIAEKEQFRFQLSVWDFAQRKQIDAFTDHSEGGRIKGLSFSSDGNYLVSGFEGGKVFVWNLKTGKKEHSIDCDRPLCIAAFSPKEDFLLVVDDKGGHIYDSKSGKRIRTIESPKQQHYRGGQFSPDGNLLATGNGITGEITLWQVATGKAIQTLRGHIGACEVLIFAPDGKRLYSGGVDGAIRVWDVKSGKELFSQNEHVGPVFACTFSPDGTFFLSGGYDGIVRKWETQTGKLIDHFPIDRQHPFEIIQIATTNEIFAVRTRDKVDGKRTNYSIQFYDFKKKQTKLLFQEQDPVFQSIVILVNLLRPKKPTRRFFRSRFQPVSFSPNQRYLLTRHSSNGLALWTMKPLRETKCWKSNSQFSYPMGFSPDSRWFFVASDDRKISVYETASRNQLFNLAGHRSRISCFIFSADYRFLLAASVDSRLMLWDLWSFTGSGPKQEEVTEKELVHWWDDLRSDDHQIGVGAIARLIQSPSKSVFFLQEKLKPSSPLPEPKINQWIRDLDHANFKTRTKAFRELDENSELMEDHLRKELKNTSSPEVQNAITRILENLDNSRSYPNGNALRQIRAVQALEYMSSKEAKELLQELSQGSSKALLTQEAKEALGRLEKDRKRGAEK